VIDESTPKTPKIKKGSFGDIFIFLNPLIIKHQRIYKNENLIQNSSFYENEHFSEWTQLINF